MQDFRHDAAKLLTPILQIPQKQAAELLEVPPNPEMGDYSFPCFKLASEWRKKPNEVAQEIVKQIKISRSDLVKEVKHFGPYVNFYLDSSKISKRILQQIYKKKNKFGSSNISKGKIMVEFSQPNTHKAFHIGHLRGTVLGDSIVKLLEFSGNNVVATNYINDVGAHVAKTIWALKKYHQFSKPKGNPGEWLGQVYTESVKALEGHEQFHEEVSNILLKLEEKKDKKLQNIWNVTRNWSLNEFKEIYKTLGVKFDIWFYESKIKSKGKRLVKYLVKKKIARKDQGAIIVDLSEYDLGVLVILKSDGTGLYATSDLALAEEKFKKRKIDKSIYVTATEQSHYFKQLFKTLQLAGFRQADKCEHVAYELVMLASGRMSSREGSIITFRELFEKVKANAVQEVESRNLKIPSASANKAGEKIALAALKYSMLKQAPNKTITFDPKQALEFQGDTGPYLLYSLLRAEKILQKVRIKPTAKVDYSLLNHEKEIKLIKKLGEFRDVVERAGEQLAPYLIANYAFELTKDFNEFYEVCSVKQASIQHKKARVLLVWAFTQTLKNAFSLLNIQTTKVM
ncbi:MAG: arginine--tRNA ligase [Nanoarchaeota archaeon]